MLDLGEYYPFIRTDHPEETFVKVFGFSPERKSMTTVIPDGSDFKIYCKGAPEAILGRCTGIVRHDGSVGKYLPEDAVRIAQVIKSMQETRHLKVMCVAYRNIYPSGGYHLEFQLPVTLILDGSKWQQAEIDTVATNFDYTMLEILNKG